MDILSVDLGWLLVILFFINFLAVLFIRTDERFWIPSIILWLFLFFGFVLVQVTNNREVEYQGLVYQNKVKTEEEVLNDTKPYELEQVRKKTHAQNAKLFRVLGFQTLLSCFWLLLGYRSTGHKHYRTSSITFTILAFLYLVLEFTVNQ